MPIKSISLVNFGPFAELKAEMRMVGILSGPNGAGKTAFLDSIRVTFGRGHDPDFIRGDMESAESIIELDTGHSVRATITRTETKRSWRAPDGKRWVYDRSLIDDIAKALAFDPIGFLAKSPADQASELLKIAPVKITPEEISKALDGVDATKANITPGMGAIDCIESIHSHIYERRRELNVSAESLEKHAAELNKALPKSTEGGWIAKASKLRADKSATEVSLRESIELVNGTFQNSKRVAESNRNDAHMAADKEYVLKLEELNAIRSGSKQAADAVCAADIDISRKDGQKRAEEVRTSYSPTLTQLTASLAQAELMAKQESEAEGTRVAIETASTQAREKREDWARLDKAIKNLAALKLELANRLPIKGVMVKDGKIVREQNGGMVPLAKWNTADQMKFCLRIGMMASGSARFVIMDRCESLDAVTRKAVFAACNKYSEEDGVQFLLASVDAYDKPPGQWRIEDGSAKEESPLDAFSRNFKEGKV